TVSAGNDVGCPEVDWETIPPTPVTPVVPEQDSSEACEVLDQIVIPEAGEGYAYFVGDDDVSGTTIELNEGEEVTIEVRFDRGYFLAEGAEIEWTFTGGEVEPCPEIVVPAIPTITTDHLCEVPDGLVVPT